MFLRQIFRNSCSNEFYRSLHMTGLRLYGTGYGCCRLQRRTVSCIICGSRGRFGDIMVPLNQRISQRQRLLKSHRHRGSHVARKYRAAPAPYNGKYRCCRSLSGESRRRKQWRLRNSARIPALRHTREEVDMVVAGQQCSWIDCGISQPR